MCLIILLSGASVIMYVNLYPQANITDITLNPQSANQWNPRDDGFLEGGQGPVPACDSGIDVDFDVCERNNGDLCLCNTEITPMFMRYPLIFEEDRTEEEKDYYRSMSWPFFIPSMYGPDQLSPCRGQSLFDYDRDNDVDLRDFAEFQTRFR